MKKFDFAIAYLWEYDEDFIHKLENALHEKNLSTFIISDHNIDEVIDRVNTQKIKFSFYLDRAWDVDDRYRFLGEKLREQNTKIFNNYENVLHSIDKATMHLEFITAGLNVPYSIIIPPFNEIEDISISLSDLAKLGIPFIIKPCNTTGGGLGVVTGAETLREILVERSNYGDDKYILQERIYPSLVDGKRAWFRVFWVIDEPIPVWWDDNTHIYSILRQDEIIRYNLEELFNIGKKIAQVSGLDFFSTEVVLSDKSKFIAIDYVNDQCDLRIKSLHFDGVPDELIDRIISKFRERISCRRKK